MALFLASALLLFLLKDVTCQSCPYNLAFTDPKPEINSVNLQCKDRFGVEVPGASFYRNSQPITNSSCLTAYPTDSSSELNVTLVSQECDGNFSCGLNGSLSEPKLLYACPVMNNSARTELVEEGTSVLLTCDFYPSPINRYETTWYRSPGSLNTVLSNTMDLQSYTENNLQQMTMYSCQINPVHGCFSNSRTPYNGPTITLRPKERYVMPMITKDLNYTRQNGGSGGVFSVSTSGTNLTHKWYKNDKLINGIGAGILEIGNDTLTVEDSNGLLRITYEASNVDYDNMTQTTRQTFGLYTNDDSATIALAVLVPIGTLSILANIILAVIICFKCKVCNKLNEAQASQQQKNIELPLQGVDRQQSNNSKQEADCSKFNSSIPMERILHSAFNLVRDCETNYKFLHCLTMMLTDVVKEMNFDSKCTDTLTAMRNDVEKLMNSMKQKAVDGTGERMVYDGPHDESMTSDSQHEQDEKIIYEKYEELYKLLNDCIKNVAPDQDKGQNLVN